MPRRSIRITISNNTTFDLKLIGKASPCHGIWSDGSEPPDLIKSKTHGTWQSESSGIATGTEGWVKYAIGNLADVVYIYWDNPFIWGKSTIPLDLLSKDKPQTRSLVAVTNVTPPCDTDQERGSQFEFRGTPSYELFPAGASGPFEKGSSGITWTDAVFNWPVLAVFNVLGLLDINLGFTIGLRAKGSVDQTIYSFYAGSKGLRALARMAGQSSVRTLFNL
jgi:hypothetical protein